MSSTSDRGERLGRVLAEYVRAVEAGGSPDREVLLREHADLAGELAEVFRNRDDMECLAGRAKPQTPRLPDTDAEHALAQQR